MRIVITAGGTEEPLDGVRRLSNISTGATGGVLAQAFAKRGAEVLLLHAERAPLGDLPVACDTFVSFADLEQLLHDHLGAGDWDVVVHLAAVGDYRVDALEVDGVTVEAGEKGKIGSGRDVVIRLAPSPKLIDSLRAWSRNPRIKVVGFKLTNDPDPASRLRQVRTLADRGVADLVVHNDLVDVGAERHLATVYRGGEAVAQVSSKDELASELWRLLGGDGS